MRWLDPADQARLKGLGLSPRRPSAPSAPGRHRTAARGFTRDFAQHRPYAPGDEARAIDWKAYARLDRYYVREYRAEDRLSLVVVLDASASMSFAGAGRPPKFDLARRAALGLAWTALAQGDEAGLIVAGAGGISGAPPRAGAAQLGALLVPAILIGYFVELTWVETLFLDAGAGLGLVLGFPAASALLVSTTLATAPLLGWLGPALGAALGLGLGGVGIVGARLLLGGPALNTPFFEGPPLVRPAVLLDDDVPGAAVL